MPDFPRPYNSGLGLDCVVSTFDLTCPAGEWQLLIGNAPTTAAWPAALRAIYVEVIVEDYFPVKALGCFVGTASGNLDLGIYDEKWNRIVSKGTTAAVAGAMWLDATTAVNGTASPVLDPGVYFLAMVVDNVTCTVRSGGSGFIGALSVHGVQQQLLGAMPLGATATPASPAAVTIPFIAMSRVAGL